MIFSQAERTRPVDGRSSGLCSQTFTLVVGKLRQLPKQADAMPNKARNLLLLGPLLNISYINSEPTFVPARFKGLSSVL